MDSPNTVATFPEPIITVFILYFCMRPTQGPSNSMKLKQKLATRYTRAQLNILALVSLRKSAQKAFRLFITPTKRRKGKLPPIFETGEPLSFRQDGHPVRGHRWQPYSDALRPSAETAPRKVLIAHGFESASRVFEHYIAALLKKG